MNMLSINQILNNKYFQYCLIGLLILLIFSNLALSAKYNIYVGDDTYYSSYIFENYFANQKEFSIARESHFFIAHTLGFFYTNIYQAGVFVLDTLGLPFWRLNVVSFLLFSAAFVVFVKAVDFKKKYLAALLGALLFWCLEPFLVMSHSVRPDASIFLAVSLMIYVLLNYHPTWLHRILLFITITISFATHQAIVPFLAGFFVAFTYLHGRDKFKLLIVIYLLAMLLYAISNKFYDYEIISRLYQSLASLPHDSKIGIFRQLYDYFFKAKFSRHIIELCLLLVPCYGLFKFKKLDKQSRSLLLLVFFVVCLYFLLGWLNVYYLPLIYLPIVVLFVLNSNDQVFRYSLLCLLLGSLVIYSLIFGCFIGNGSWQRLELLKPDFFAIIQEAKQSALPGYFVFLNPEKFRSFNPLEQVDWKKIDAYDLVVLDSQNKSKENYLLGKYNFVKSFAVGNIASQGLEKGSVYFYLRAK